MSSPVFFYGKLPSFGDFVRYNASGSEVRALDRWIQEALYASALHFGRDWDDAYGRTPAYHFVFAPEDAGILLIGILQPSRDKSERKYPFCVALKKERRTFDARTIPLIPAMFARFFEESREIVRLGMDGFPLEDLEERSDHSGTSVEENPETSHWDFQDYLARTTQERFWSGLFGDFHDPRKFLIVQNIQEIFRTSAPRSLKIGIRFPLSGQEQSLLQEVCFWVHLCSRLLADTLANAHLFWKAHRKNGKDYLFLFLGRVPPRSFIQLVDPDAENDFIWKIDEEGKEKLTQSDIRISPGYGTILSRGGFTLADVLDEFGRPPEKGEDFD